VPDTAWPAFDVERSSVRVVLLDADDRLLLFRTVDLTMPEVGQWWELPGGGVEGIESPAETAVRELAEETGLVLPVSAVEGPRWRRDTTYCHRHVRVLQHEVVVVARVAEPAPALRSEGRTPEELDAYVGHRWWTLAEVEAATASTRFFPGTLAVHLRAFLGGAHVDEPLDVWN
jgi:8-oxo-dGTP pyrophosphatase MutT (NUDIX family)